MSGETRRRGARGRAGGRDAGFVLFGVLVGVLLVGVGLMAANTLWSQVLQRDREAELLFRGEAVARAIERFQRDRPGALPETLEELVEGRYLRRAWNDPFTGGPFRLLRREAAAGSVGAGGFADTAALMDEGMDAAAVEHLTARAGERTPAPGADREEAPGAAATDTPAGIIGVAGSGDLLSFRIYEGARRYRDWRFEAGSAAASPGPNPRPARPANPRSPNPRPR